MKGLIKPSRALWLRGSPHLKGKGKGKVKQRQYERKTKAKAERLYFLKVSHGISANLRGQGFLGGMDAHMGS